MGSIVFYFRNYSTVGHAAQVFSLADALKREYGKRLRVAVVESGVRRVPYFDFPSLGRYLFVKEPEVWAFPDKEHGLRECLAQRYARIGGFVLRQKPEVFLTEYLPFCRHFDTVWLPLLFRALKSRFQTRILSSCTYLTAHSRTNEFFDAWYDGVLFHVPEPLASGYKEYLSAPQISWLDHLRTRHKNRVFYTGYTSSAVRHAASEVLACRKRYRVAGKKPLIVVSRGGRKDSLKLLALALNAARIRPGYQFLISAGGREHAALVKDACAEVLSRTENARLIDFIHPDFDILLQGCSVSVNLGGYVTMTRLFAYRTRTLVFPTRNSEQQWHARLLQRFLGARVMGTASGLRDFAAHLDSLVAAGPKRAPGVPSSWLDGIGRSARIIAGISGLSV